MRWAILDTNVYIDVWTGALAVAKVEELCRGFIIRHSAVVMFELRAGARGAAQRRLVAELFKHAVIRWAPTDSDWWRAGQLVSEIGDAQRWETSKRREFQNDSLIALTARRQGASVITRNRSDFTLLRRAVGAETLFL